VNADGSTADDGAELFPLIDEEGHVTGRATRKACHGGTMWLHPVIHLHIFNTAGELYLQRRSLKKDIQPGKWDTAVGGHVDYGEQILQALRREAREELGLTAPFVPVELFHYVWQSERERETSAKAAFGHSPNCKRPWGQRHSRLNSSRNCRDSWRR
jgi:isopentenyldiphosphate isomerase